MMEEYDRKIRIEAELSLLLSRTVIMPAASKELKELFQTIRDAGDSVALRSLQKTANSIAVLLDAIDTKNDILEELIAQERSEDMVDAMRSLREEVDQLERILADATWPLPKYRELLFLY